MFSGCSTLFSCLTRCSGTTANSESVLRRQPPVRSVANPLFVSKMPLNLYLTYVRDLSGGGTQAKVEVRADTSGKQVVVKSYSGDGPDSERIRQEIEFYSSLDSSLTSLYPKLLDSFDYVDGDGTPVVGYIMAYISPGISLMEMIKGSEERSGGSMSYSDLVSKMVPLLGSYAQHFSQPGVTELEKSASFQHFYITRLTKRLTDIRGQLAGLGMDHDLQSIEDFITWIKLPLVSSSLQSNLFASPVHGDLNFSNIVDGQTLKLVDPRGDMMDSDALSDLGKLLFSIERECLKEEPVGLLKELHSKGVAFFDDILERGNFAKRYPAFYKNYRDYMYVIEFVSVTQLFADVYYRLGKGEEAVADTQLRAAIEKLHSFQDEHSKRIEKTVRIEVAHQKCAV